jgi:hypothetical protein
MLLNSKWRLSAASRGRGRDRPREWRRRTSDVAFHRGVKLIRVGLPKVPLPLSGDGHEFRPAAWQERQPDRMTARHHPRSRETIRRR